MGEQTWSVEFEDGVHMIHLSHGYWSGARQIMVDGQIHHKGRGSVLVWGLGSRDVIRIGHHTCTVRVKPNLRNNSYDYSLEVDGQLQSDGGNSGAVSPRSARFRGGLLIALALLEIAQYGKAHPWDYAWIVSGLCLLFLGGAWGFFASGVALSAVGVYVAVLYPSPGSRWVLVVLGALLSAFGLYHISVFKRLHRPGKHDDPKR